MQIFPLYAHARIVHFTEAEFSVQCPWANRTFYGVPYTAFTLTIFYLFDGSYILFLPREEWFNSRWGFTFYGVPHNAFTITIT